MGMFMAVGRGQDNPPRMIVMRSGGEGRARRPRPPSRDRRQGRLLRLGRHQHQAVRPDGRDEDGQDGGMHGDLGHRDRCRACPRHAAPCLARRSRTCPVPIRPGPATSSGAERQVGRHHEHRRRGPADPGRCDDLCRATRGDPSRRRRDAHRRRRARPGTSRHRSVRDTGGLVRRRSTAAAKGPASATGSSRSIDDYVPEMDSWYADIQNAGRPRARSSRAGSSSASSSRGRGSTSTSGDRLFPQGPAVRAAGATGVTHATLVELALAGARAGCRGRPPDRSSAAPRAGRGWPFAGLGALGLLLASSPTGSRPAGPSTTGRPPAGRSTGGPSWSAGGALAFGCLPRVSRTSVPSRCSVRGSSR